MNINKVKKQKTKKKTDATFSHIIRTNEFAVHT